MSSGSLQKPLEEGFEEPSSLAVSDEPVANLSRGTSLHHLQEERDKKDPSLPLDCFDWKHGFFRTHGRPLWIQNVAKICIASLLCLIPLVVTGLGLIKDSYTLFASEPPVRPLVSIEILRAMLLLGSSWLSYLVIQVLLYSIAWFTFMFAKNRSVDVEDAVKQSVEQTLSIRQYFGWAGASVVAAMLARALYPHQIVEETHLMVLSTVKDAAKDKIDVAQLSKDMDDFARRGHRFFIAQGCLSLALVSCLCLAEKLVLKALAHHYHTQSMAERTRLNKFARRILRFLRVHINRTTKTKNPGRNGELIFDALAKGETIGRKDFVPFLGEDSANRFFDLIDTDLVGCMAREQFIRAVDAVYCERAAINRAYLDQSLVMSKFDRMMMVLVWLLSFFIVMVVYNPPIRIFLPTVVGILGALAFMFQQTVKTAFDSIVFVIVTHPFDAQDWVIIKDQYYQVEEVGLWTTTFVTSDGKTVYMSNKSLVSLPIVNLRRSPIMSETIAFSVLPSVDPDKFVQLEARLRAWLKQHESEFSQSFQVRGFTITDREHMRVELSLGHRANFNDMTRKDYRTRRFTLYLKECIQELGIELSPPIRAL